MAEKEKNAENEQDSSKRTTEISLDFGFGGLLEGLGNLVKQVADLAESDEGQGVKQKGMFRVKGLGEETKGVWGFSIRTGLGGTTKVEHFGNIRTTDEGPHVARVREPLVDLLDETREIIIVVELPGVSEEEIHISIEDDILALETKGAHAYAKEVLLPTSVLADSMRQTYRNGILTLRLQKVQGA